MMNIDGMKLANLTGSLSFLLLKEDNVQYSLGYTQTRRRTVTELIAAAVQK